MTDHRSGQPLLTIAIPTWNRAPYLTLNLCQLALQGRDTWNEVEVLVSDNASTDDTPRVIAEAVAAGLPVRYIRNTENIGSDCNIAQCYNLAVGRYVMILGDDDLLVDDALFMILELLRQDQYGVVSLRPYGYERDFRLEYPGGGGDVLEFDDVGEFIVKLGVLSTLISANVISKELLAGVDARDFCGTNLVQTHLLFRAATAARLNLWVDRYLIACKRNNSGGYVFSQVFVERFGAILDEFRGGRISEAAVNRLERRLLTAYYPFYVWRQRLTGGEDLDAARVRFQARFAGYKTYWLCLAPILRLPRPLALVWGAVVVVVGRVLDGDLRRGLSFMLNRMDGFRKGGLLQHPNPKQN